MKHRGKSLSRLALAAGLAFAPWPVPAKPPSPALEMARQLNEAFIEVADTVSPSVVVIEVAHRPDSKEEDDNPLLDLFPPELRRQFEERFRRRDSEKPSRRAPVFDGRGSGVVIRKDGFILTNTHVVEDAEKIRVRFRDGREYAAEVRGKDPLSDIAVIKIDATELPEAKLGDSSKTRVGEFAIAIGAPFDLDYSVTFGHVSAKGRSHVIPNFGTGSLGEKMDQDFIQTDASINPGNSGGPLVNIYGEVIGINTLIRGLNTGIGFAIPINLAKQVAEQLISNGKYDRAWLGVRIRALRDDTDFREMVKDQVKDGVIVYQIDKNGPAYKVLQPSDVIISVDGQPVSNSQDLRYQIRSKAIGSSVAMEVFRKDNKGEGKVIKLKVKTAAWPDEEAVSASKSPDLTSSSAKSFGLTVQNLTQELAEEYDVALTEGVIVTEVEPGSAAAKKNIQPGDIITEVNHHPVKTPKEFRDAAQKGNGSAIINLISDGSPKFEILKDDGD
ncbi:MAG: trypsin-like peptidase domain-containing protein [Verrucomicrobiota bacterium]|jgi:serine protease Do